MSFFWVFIGGGLGSCSRYGIARLFGGLALEYPIATLLTNLLACAILGYGISLVAAGKLTDAHKMLLLTGFCGGFSTFSTFSAEVFELYNTGQVWTALLYALLSVIMGVVVLGYFLTK